VAVFSGVSGRGLGSRDEVGTVRQSQLVRLVHNICAGGLYRIAVLLISSNEAVSIGCAVSGFWPRRWRFLFGEPNPSMGGQQASRAVTPYGTVGLLLVSHLWRVFSTADWASFCWRSRASGAGEYPRNEA